MSELLCFYLNLQMVSDLLLLPKGVLPLYSRLMQFQHKDSEDEMFQLPNI